MQLALHDVDFLCSNSEVYVQVVCAYNSAVSATQMQ